MGNLTKKDYLFMLLSLVIAIFLWASVMDIRNPETEYIYKNIPIILDEGNNGPEANGLTILDGLNKTVNITVEGRRTDITAVSTDKISAHVNLDGLDEPGEYTLPIVTSIPGSITLVSKSPETISVSIDKIISKSVPVRISADSTAAEGYVLSEPVVKPNSVTVKGPRKLVSAISYAQVTIKPGTLNKDFNMTQKITLIDNKGKEIKDEHLELSKGTVDVKISALRQKEVPVEVQIMGDPPEGFRVEGITANPSKVTITGDPAIVDGIEKLLTEPVNISSEPSVGTATMNLIIPEGVEVTDGRTNCDVYFSLVEDITNEEGNVPVTDESTE